MLEFMTYHNPNTLYCLQNYTRQAFLEVYATLLYSDRLTRNPVERLHEHYFVLKLLQETLSHTARGFVYGTSQFLFTV